jgi:DNA phosphorothioation-dependent restriction protein DptG
MSKNEVDLNDPLNWFIADSMDDYDVRLDPETAKELVHRHNVYPKLVSALKEAIEALRQAGQTEKAESLSTRLKELGES